MSIVAALHGAQGCIYIAKGISQSVTTRVCYSLQLQTVHVFNYAVQYTTKIMHGYSVLENIKSLGKVCDDKLKHAGLIV